MTDDLDAFLAEQLQDSAFRDAYARAELLSTLVRCWLLRRLILR